MNTKKFYNWNNSKYYLNRNDFFYFVFLNIYII